jgi:hypothetical protein
MGNKEVRNGHSGECRCMECSRNRTLRARRLVHLLRDHMGVASACGQLGPAKRNRSRMTTSRAAVTCPSCLNYIETHPQQ